MLTKRTDSNTQAVETVLDARLAVRTMAGRTLASGQIADHLFNLERRLIDLAALLTHATIAPAVDAVDVTDPLAVDLGLAS